MKLKKINCLKLKRLCFKYEIIHRTGDYACKIISSIRDISSVKHPFITWERTTKHEKNSIDGKKFNRCFSKEAQEKPKKRCSKPLATEKMQVENTIKHHSTSTSMAKIQRTDKYW